MSAYFSRLAGVLLLVLCFLFFTANSAQAGTEKKVVSETTAETLIYTIQTGDTLSGIAREFNVNLKQLIRVNNLESTVIHPRQNLVIPPEGQSETTTLSRGSISREELMLLARAIHAEARGEGFIGQVAVGAVIVNRVHSKLFPNTVREVIMQSNKHVFQFTPVSNGTINLEPDQSAIEAALEALEGNDPTDGALFFYNPTISTDTWITTLPVVTRIGRHVFATKA